jgi:hypothetical protein
LVKVLESLSFTDKKKLQIFQAAALCRTKFNLPLMMPADREAADHLKTIRALMERATIYRAISAPTALAGGLSALALCGLLWQAEPGTRPSPESFVGLWVGALILVSGFNVWLLYRSARQRGDAFASSGMRMALRSVAPPLAAGFVLSTLAAVTRSNGYADIAAFWILFYGLALLAMGSFAPRSLLMLGTGFFAMGLLAFLPEVRALEGRSYQASLLYMALSFGILHLLYAGYVFVSQKNRKPSVMEDLA